MSGLYIERRIMDEGSNLPLDIAGHIYSRQLHGGVVIITNTPNRLLASVREQWQNVIRRRHRERSRALNPDGALELADDIAATQQLRFVAAVPGEAPDADVYFARADQLLKEPPICHTLYAAIALDEVSIAVLTSRMPRHGLIVLY